jgi:hypothetical protein
VDVEIGALKQGCDAAEAALEGADQQHVPGSVFAVFHSSKSAGGITRGTSAITALFR